MPWLWFGHNDFSDVFMFPYSLKATIFGNAHRGLMMSALHPVKDAEHQVCWLIRPLNKSLMFLHIFIRIYSLPK